MNTKINFENVAMYATEVTEKQYYDSYECLPPIYVNSLNDNKFNGFIVAEPYSHNEQGVPVFALFFKLRINNTEHFKYYTLNEYVYLKHENNPVYWYDEHLWSVCSAYSN